MAMSPPLRGATSTQLPIAPLYRLLRHCAPVISSDETPFSIRCMILTFPT